MTRLSIIQGEVLKLERMSVNGVEQRMRSDRRTRLLGAARVTIVIAVVREGGGNQALEETFALKLYNRNRRSSSGVPQGSIVREDTVEVQ